MSTFAVTAEQLIIHPHPNADVLELAQVGEFRAVVPKDVYKTGDWALYIPEAAVLPPDLIEELGLTGKLAGKDKNRVKAVRLRGEISQGIVCRPSKFNQNGSDYWNDPHFFSDAHEAGIDFSSDLDVHKYVPPIPTHMSGDVEVAPDLVRWIDVENLRRFPNVFEDGERVIASEKIHGTACLLTYVPTDGRAFVSSKGFGHDYLALQENEKNLYWRAIHWHNMIQVAEWIAADWQADRVGIFGEVYGAGVQDLHYGANAGANDTLGYRVFDIAVVVRGERVWLPQTNLREYSDLYDFPIVPTLYVGQFNFSDLESVALGTSLLADHIREGIVIRALPERSSDVLGGRAIAKLINPDYLTRKGGTEYE